MRGGEEDVITIDSQSGSERGSTTSDSIEIINDHGEDAGTVLVEKSQAANVLPARGGQAEKPVGKQSFGQVRIGGASPEPVVASQMQGLSGADTRQSSFDYGNNRAIYQPSQFNPAIQPPMQVQSPKTFRRYFEHTDEASGPERRRRSGRGRKRSYTRWDSDATINQLETPQFDMAMGGAIPRDRQQTQLWSALDEHVVADTQQPPEHVVTDAVLTSSRHDTDPPEENGDVATAAERPTARKERIDPREAAKPMDPMARMRSAFRKG